MQELGVISDASRRGTFNLAKQRNGQLAKYQVKRIQYSGTAASKGGRNLATIWRKVAARDFRPISDASCKISSDILQCRMCRRWGVATSGSGWCQHALQNIRQHFAILGMAGSSDKAPTTCCKAYGKVSEGAGENMVGTVIIDSEGVHLINSY